MLAVDDERPALEDLARMLQRAPQVTDVALASSGDEALRKLTHQRFDALFLDVRMPGLDGLELARLLGQFANPPAVVFVSAHEDGAVGAFQLDLQALDYLMKPVSRVRIGQALDRVLADRSAHRSQGAHAESLTTEDAVDEIIPVEHQRGGATRLLSRSTVLYVKAEGDYVRLVADSGRFLVRAAMSELERRWTPHGFVRVHRSYLVNLRRAVEIRPELGGGATVVMSDGSEVPVARRLLGDLRRRLRQ
ncbi:MAG: LytR/AlgR family response regulator transcription factor [Solirubrobacteraceae bacterium]